MITQKKVSDFCRKAVEMLRFDYYKANFKYLTAYVFSS